MNPKIPVLFLTPQIFTIIEHKSMNEITRNSSKFSIHMSFGNGGFLGGESKGNGGIAKLSDPVEDVAGFVGYV